MSSPALAVSRRNRRTPYMERIEALGVQSYSIVNHTLLPKAFGRTVEERAVVGCIVPAAGRSPRARSRSLGSDDDPPGSWQCGCRTVLIRSPD